MEMVESVRKSLDPVRITKHRAILKAVGSHEAMLTAVRQKSKSHPLKACVPNRAQTLNHSISSTLHKPPELANPQEDPLLCWPLQEGASGHLGDLRASCRTLVGPGQTPARGLV